MLLGLEKIEKKEDLKKYTKEQLIEMFWERLEVDKDFMAFFLNANEKELLDKQQFARLIKTMKN